MCFDKTFVEVKGYEIIAVHHEDGPAVFSFIRIGMWDYK